MPKTTKEQPVLRFHSGYFPFAHAAPETQIERAAKALEGVDFDTMVGTGLSGALTVPVLARGMGKHWLIVRKPDDDTHSWERAEGTLGHRWIFVDDFRETGETEERVHYAVDQIQKYSRFFSSEYVGTYLYQNKAERRWRPAKHSTAAKLNAAALAAYDKAFKNGDKLVEIDPEDFAREARMKMGDKTAIQDVPAYELWADQTMSEDVEAFYLNSYNKDHTEDVDLHQVGQDRQALYS